jgi:hypothetical protein
MPYKTYKGFYQPRNPKKYRGDPTQCVYRSLWERRFMQFCDQTDSVLEWSSEEVVIPYRSPMDRRVHRYFVDFWIKVKNKEGLVETMLVEIKPKKQTVEPILEGKKPTRKNIELARDWIVNSAKWEAAKNYCADRGWSFKILTEDNIFGAKA